jgi:3-oxoacyl-[acyl-carrier protein] reductase/meso-butanediol dehydrogenase/(S,S)-butanediol dehydrogenase/diacetyl reductase
MHDDLTTEQADSAFRGPRTIVVTGGTKGIGLDIVQAFHRSGDRVFAAARHEPAAGALPDGVTFVGLEAAEEDSHVALVRAALEQTGRLDVYINNVGRSAWRPIEEIDARFLEEMLAVNLKSAFWGSRAAAQKLESGGVILNISSLAGKRGSANNSAYVAAKFGMNGLTQSLAKELGPRGIRVNALCPVLVDTPGLRTALGDLDSPAAGRPDEFFGRFAREQSALGRLPLGSEVAEMALAMCARASSAVTGQCLNVDCGVLPQ